MKKEIGLWINRREAIIVIFTGEKEEIKNFSASDFDDFYGEVVSVVGDADSIRIFGPDGAKDDLEKRLQHEGIENFVVETVGKTTNHQQA